MTYQDLRGLLFDPLRREEKSEERAHIVELDSLRGLAAISVLLFHFLMGWLESAPPHFVTLLGYIPLLTNGTAAVILFFVLSGFVLTLPRTSPAPQSYPAYVARRVCRIYLPYLAALAAAILGCWRFHGLEMYGIQFHMTWRDAPSLSLIAQHLAFLGRYDVDAYNAPIWSLVHEMRISLIFPLLCLLSLRLRAWAAGLAALLFPVAARLIERFSGPYTGSGYPGVHAVFWADTLAFCGVFLIGSILSRHRVQIVSYLASVPKSMLSLLLVAAIGLYQYPALFHIPHFLITFAIGLAAACVIMLALVPGGWLSKMLRLAPVVWVGRVSYSLYLTHVPILLIMSILMYRKVPYGYLLVPYLALSFLAAAAFHRWLEIPSIHLGRVLARRLDGRAKVPASEELNAVKASV